MPAHTTSPPPRLRLTRRGVILTAALAGLAFWPLMRLLFTAIAYLAS